MIFRLLSFRDVHLKLHQDSRVTMTLTRKFILEMYETMAITPARLSARLSLSALYHNR